MQISFENLPQKVLEIFQQNQEILKELQRINPPQNAERYFNVDELIGYLPQKPARSTVYGLVHAKRIPYHKQSKHLHFLKSEIDLWLKEKGGVSHD